jgi:hypothetical protein
MILPYGAWNFVCMVLRRKSAIYMWKQAQQEVRQHWFNDSYIADYIQVQYSVQYKGYNLIGVTTVEASATRGTTREK